MSRRHYLITYDVSDDNRRGRIFQTLRDHGDHTQYSVFLCQLNSRELIALKGLLQSLTHQSEDQVLIADLGPVAHGVGLEIETIGRSYDPPTRAMIV